MSFVSADPEGWMNDTRLTFAPFDSLFPSPSIDPQGNVHIAWQDYRDDQFSSEIYYKKLNNNGQGLTPDIRLTFAPSTPMSPSLSTDPQGNVHIAWVDNRDGNWEIYYKKLNNNGQGLTPDIRLTSNPDRSEGPSLSIDSQGNVHVAWYDTRDNYYGEIYYKKLNNNGQPLTPDLRLTFDPASSWAPSLAIDPQGNVHIAWEDSRGDGYTKIYYKKLNNNGQSLTSDIRLTPSPSEYPSLSTDPQGNVHVAWINFRDGNREIYYKKLNNNGQSLTPDIRLTFNPAESYRPSISTDPQGNVHIAWEDLRDGNGEIYYKKLNNNGQSLTSDIRLTFNSVGSGDPSLAIDPQGNVHIAWEDLRDGNGEIYYKRSLPVVLLVHGIYSNDLIWDQVETALENEGFLVYRVGEVLNQPGLVPNNGNIIDLAGQVKRAIDIVKSQTGASKVNIVAHSMGGLATRFYIRTNYQNDIDKLITLGTPNEGAPIAQGPIAHFFGNVQGNSSLDLARIQMIPGNIFLQLLNSNFDTMGINHTEIAGTSTNPLVLFVQPSYAFRTTDSIVPRSSVNIPNIACFQNQNTHNDILGTAYYEDQRTITNIVNILKGRTITISSCPIEQNDQPEQGNNVQVITRSNTISPNERQVAITSLDAGTQLGGLLNWNSGELYLEIVTPTGNVINITTYSAYANVSYYNSSSAEGNLEWITIGEPEHGNWSVRVLAANIQSPQLYTVSLFLEKPATIVTQTDKTTYNPNEPAIVTGRLTETTQPVLNASVAATITNPSTGSTLLILYDDGNHYDGNADDGLYGNLFNETSQEGMYLVDANASRPELFELHDSISFFVELFPDLKIDEQDITMTPSSLTPGENATINVQAIIHNIGEKDAANTTIEFYDGDPAQNGVRFGNRTVNIPVNSSTFVSASLRYIFASNPSLVTGGIPRINMTINISIADTAMKSHDIHVRISPLSGFLESNYTNNQANKVLEFSPVTYVLALSMGTSPGIPLGDGRVIPLNPDMLFLLSLQSGQLIGLRDYVGFMNEQGMGTSYWDIPNIPELNGITVYAAFVVLDHTLPIPFVSISYAVPLTFVS